MPEARGIHWKYAHSTLQALAPVSPTVQVEITVPIATVRLGRSGRDDDIDSKWLEALASTFHDLAGRDDVTCVAVRRTGAGMLSLGSEREVVRARGDALGSALLAIQRCPHATVAIVEGTCTGLWLEIAGSCDLRVCGESSRFGEPIDRFGLSSRIPDPVTRLLGPSTVLSDMGEGVLIGAERARRAGLVSRIYADVSVVEQGYGFVARIAAGAPLVNRWHKNVVRRLLDGRRGGVEEAEGAEPFLWVN